MSAVGQPPSSCIDQPWPSSQPSSSPAARRSWSSIAMAARAIGRSMPFRSMCASPKMSSIRCRCASVTPGSATCPSGIRTTSSTGRQPTQLRLHHPPRRHDRPRLRFPTASPSPTHLPGWRRDRRGCRSACWVTARSVSMSAERSRPAARPRASATRDFGPSNADKMAPARCHIAPPPGKA